MEAIEIIEYIEQEARLVLQSSWDNSGVQVASKNSAITQIAVMLDPTPALVGAALEAGANFILSHHPLSMSPKYPNKVDNYFEALRLLIRADAWLYSAHTSLDVNPWGTSRWLAEALELKNGRIMWPLRVAVSGKAATPGGAVELCQILGRDETLRRIQFGIAQLS